MTLNLLYKRSIPVTDKISIRIPTVREVIEDEDGYYGAVTMLTAMPIDFMVQLDDMGIDFTELDEYSLFLLLFQGLKDMDTSLIFDGLDLSKFEMAINEVNGMIVFVDRENDITIDRVVHDKIAATLRKIHHLEKNRKRPGNEEAKKYMIERARKKMRSKRNRASISQLESLIIAMVNTEQFKYGYEDVLDISIYQFNESVRQIINKVDYDNRMIGVYAGTVNAKELSQDDLNWLVHK